MLTFICAGALVFYNPKNTAMILKIKEPPDNFSSNAKWLLNAIGWSSFSIAITAGTLLYNSSTGVSVQAAIAIGILPRLYIVFNYYVTLNNHPKDFTMVIHALVPVYGVAVVCIASMFTNNIPILDNMGPTDGGLVFGKMCSISGIMLMIAPKQFAKML